MFVSGIGANTDSTIVFIRHYSCSEQLWLSNKHNRGIGANTDSTIVFIRLYYTVLKSCGCLICLFVVSVPTPILLLCLLDNHSCSE